MWCDWASFSLTFATYSIFALQRNLKTRNPVDLEDALGTWGSSVAPVSAGPKAIHRSDKRGPPASWIFRIWVCNALSKQSAESFLPNKTFTASCSQSKTIFWNSPVKLLQCDKPLISFMRSSAYFNCPKFDWPNNFLTSPTVISFSSLI